MLTQKFSVDGEIVEKKFVLIDQKTGETLELPVKRKDWTGKQDEIVSFKASRFEGNQGYVFTLFNEVLVPSVFDLKIVEVRQ